MKKINVVLLILFIISQAFAENKGKAIMEEVLSGSGWNDMTSDLTLTLTNSRGQERVREIAFYSKDNSEGLNEMLMRFVLPADVKGTGFLTLETKSGTDERYLYLPARRKISKISSSGSGGNFMSSDFTYYDIGEPKLEDWIYSYLGEEEYKGKMCYKVAAVPASKLILDDTGYGKIIRWIDTSNYQTLYSKYYDKALNHWKNLTVNSYYVSDKGSGFASDMLFEDIQLHHSSRMVFKDIKVDQGISDTYFTPRYLQRSR